MARIGVDIDGVLYDFAASFEAWMGIRGFETMDLPVASDWHFYMKWGFDHAGFMEEFCKGVDEGVIFKLGDPREGSHKALNLIKDHGHTIHIGTDRRVGSPGRAQLNTCQWFDIYDLPYDTLTITADKTILDVDIFVEDKLENYDALMEHGIDTWLINRPWNERKDSRQRIGSVLEFAELVVEKFG